MLITNDPIYSIRCKRRKYIDRVVEVQVFTVGFYSFSINSSVDVYGYLHKDYYHAISLIKNSLLQLHGSCGPNKFKLTIHLQPNIKYMLVIRTNDFRMKGLLSVFVTGPNNVSLKSTGEYIDSVYVKNIS